jgi:hypothetical protein
LTRRVGVGCDGRWPSQQEPKAPPDGQEQATLLPGQAGSIDPSGQPQTGHLGQAKVRRWPLHVAQAWTWGAARTASKWKPAKNSRKVGCCSSVAIGVSYWRLLVRPAMIIAAAY